MQTKVLSRDSFCWVYIVKENKETEEIGYSPSLPRMLAICRGKHLTYYRQFSHPVDGVAHKLYLQNLSAESLMHFVSYYNADGSNLLEEFQFINYHS
ncbi:hypothetical protein [Parabacteroides sp. PF5-6]|uniref:hypothetical protein n=1 Tax=Parabacteroides sp. PF5-6 TaxID=1742403 RepID=UPI0024068423|nr:hypothetical protein [Parabacteroides sp. PF5-6]